MEGRNFHVRWMIRRDLPEVMAVEEDCFEHPWTLEQMQSCLAMRNHTALVVEHGDRVIGFAIYGRLSTHFELVSIAVTKAYRRKRVGTLLYRKILHSLCKLGLDRLVVMVREGNLPAQLFFKFGQMKAEQVIRNYYADSAESAYQFALTVGQ